MSRSRSAELARQNGARWESYIRKECNALSRAGLAIIQKNWEAPQLRGSNIKREKSKPDFSGFLLDGGRHVVFEAKANFSGTSFPFNQISKHQMDHLVAASNAGAVAFIYVLDGVQRKWVIPAEKVVDVISKSGRASFPYHPENKTYQKHRGETWLDTWRRLEEEGLA